jgi:hypothetical protein
MVFVWWNDPPSTKKMVKWSLNQAWTAYTDGILLVTENTKSIGWLVRHGSTPFISRVISGYWMIYIYIVFECIWIRSIEKYVYIYISQVYIYILLESIRCFREATRSLRPPNLSSSVRVSRSSTWTRRTWKRLESPEISASRRRMWCLVKICPKKTVDDRRDDCDDRRDLFI